MICHISGRGSSSNSNFRSRSDLKSSSNQIFSIRLMLLLLEGNQSQKTQYIIRITCTALCYYLLTWRETRKHAPCAAKSIDCMWLLGHSSHWASSCDPSSSALRDGALPLVLGSTGDNITNSQTWNLKPTLANCQQLHPPPKEFSMLDGWTALSINFYSNDLESIRHPRTYRVNVVPAIVHQRLQGTAFLSSFLLSWVTAWCEQKALLPVMTSSWSRRIEQIHHAQRDRWVVHHSSGGYHRWTIEDWDAFHGLSWMLIAIPISRPPPDTSGTWQQITEVKTNDGSLAGLQFSDHCLIHVDSW